MNQTKQVTSITGADIDAAIQGERITPLEAAAKAIFSLQRQVTEQDERIERLETAAAQAGEAVVIIGAECLEQDKRIEQLARRALDHIGRIVELERLTDRLVNRQNASDERIERLERDVKLNSGLINCLQNVGLKDNKRIERLEAALRDIASCLTTSKVSEAIQTASEGHSHLILDAESVQIVGKACHRLAE